jgi:hypothetical protein
MHEALRSFGDCSPLYENIVYAYGKCRHVTIVTS